MGWHYCSPALHDRAIVLHPLIQRTSLLLMLHLLVASDRLSLLLFYTTVCPTHYYHVNSRLNRALASLLRCSCHSLSRLSCVVSAFHRPPCSLYLCSTTGNRPSTGSTNSSTTDSMQSQQSNPAMQPGQRQDAVQTLEAALHGEPLFANRSLPTQHDGNQSAASAQPHSHQRQLKHHRPASSSSSKPHALQSFDTIASTLKGKQLAIFLDYDGTLTPIVSDPSQARITAETTATIETLSQRHPTAIVTGRKIDTIRGFLNLPALYYAGSHGFDIRKPGGDKLKQVADDYLAELGEVRDDVKRRVEGVKGAMVEDNVYSVSVHYRNADDDGKQRIEQAVTQAFVGHEERLQLLPGKMVHELRPAIEWHKGEAVEYLLSVMYEKGERGGKAAVAMGDDTTDEDAFRLLESDENSVTVLVLPEGGGERQTNAKYVCQQPEVADFLKRLAAL